MAAFTIEFSLNGKKFPSVEAGFEHVANQVTGSTQDVQRITKRNLERFLKEIATILKNRHSTAWTKGAGKKDSLYSRSGEGMRSVGRSIHVAGTTLNNTFGEMGIKKELAIHERGGEIRPKKAKFLTIPLDAMLTPRGLPKRLSVSDRNKTFVAESKNGNLLIFLKKGRRTVPLFLLIGPNATKNGLKAKQSSVRIKPKLGMISTAQKNLDRFTDRLASDLIASMKIKETV